MVSVHVSKTGMAFGPKEVVRDMWELETEKIYLDSPCLLHSLSSQYKAIFSSRNCFFMLISMEIELSVSYPETRCL